jgi:outer membrane autotransporter protein
MVSGYKHRSHDGYSVQSAVPAFSGSTPGFEEENYGLTIGGRFDGSEFFGASPNSVTLGLLGNYTRTEIDIDAPLAGLSGGSATVDSWSVGTFGLVTDGTRYGLLSVTGTFGSPETETEIVGPISAAFNNYAVATSAVVGVLVPLGGSVRLDLRGGLDYVYARSEDFEDSLGVDYTDGRTQEFAGSASARLFSVIKADGYDVRPFVQAGVSHRFHYENELKVDGIAFSFDEADTSLFGRAGVDFSLSQSTQAYLAVRGDASEDFEAIAAQFGLTFKLD